MEIKIKVFVMKIERAITFISETKWNEIKSTKANIRIPKKNMDKHLHMNGNQIYISPNVPERAMIKCFF